MAPYVDGYLVPVPRDRVEDYRALAASMADIFMEYGALSVLEAVAEDVAYGTLTSFPRAVLQTETETVILSYITYRDRAHRDDVSGKVMADPRVAAMDMAFIDGKRMIWGGFQTIVSR